MVSAHGLQVRQRMDGWENWQVGMLALGALATGILIPVVIQVQMLLRQLKKLASAAQPTVEDIRIISARAKKLTDALEGREVELGDFIQTASELGESLKSFRNTAHIASAVGAAVGAGVRAFQHPKTNENHTAVNNEEQAP